MAIRNRRLVLPTTALLAAAAGFVALARAQDEAPPSGPLVTEPAAPSALAEAPPEGLYVGPATCAQDICHGSTRPRDVFSVDQNEYYVWLNRDRHARAYEVLYEERSAAIAGNLGLDRPAPEAPACLACHTLAVSQGLKAGPIEATDGISCEACHGPASGWRDGHTAEDWTRDRSMEAGMTDLEDLTVRARVCLGCHLGEAGDPAKVVDHDLIAAGHPPLRFELDNYSQAMPAHWRSAPGDGVRAWAVGQAAGFQDGLRELARRAREGPWPDFSVLTCQACHHSLSEERYRSGLDRAYRDRIGMPPWSPARWVVLRVLVERYAPQELSPMDAAVERLARQVSRLSTPPVEVSATADALARRLDPLVARMGGVSWDAAEARAVALAIAARRDEPAAIDVHSAEQTVQALYSLSGHLLEERPRLLATGLVADLARLTAEIEDPEAYDRERFRAALAAVEERLR